MERASEMLSLMFLIRKEDCPLWADAQSPVLCISKQRRQKVTIASRFNQPASKVHYSRRVLIEIIFVQNCVGDVVHDPLAESIHPVILVDHIVKVLLVDLEVAAHWIFCTPQERNKGVSSSDCRAVKAVGTSAQGHVSALDLFLRFLPLSLDPIYWPYDSTIACDVVRTITSSARLEGRLTTFRQTLSAVQVRIVLTLD